MTPMMNTSVDEWSGNISALDYNSSSNAGTADNDFPPLNIPYVVCEILVAVTAVIGNALTIVVFAIDRKLRRLTNYYIVSLAMADLLVGMPGIPFAILTSIGIPQNKYMCLPMLSLLLILCTVSIFCLVAVSVDRYWAILYPLRYSRVMTAKIARRIIMLCWIAGTCLGVLPMMGWREDYEGDCVFTHIMNYNYLVFIYFSTIVGPGVLMALFYTHIYTVVLKQTKLSVKSEHGTLRQIAAQEPQSEGGSMSTQHGGSQKQRPHFLMNRNQSRSQGEVNKCDSRRYSTSTNIVHQVTHASRREVKAAKSLSIIVLFFLICWFPLYTINCVQAFCHSCVVPGQVMYFTIILTHVNSAVNPFLYAYHMKDFRHALKTFILQRILRRQLHSDPIYGSRLSPHHSTLYRVAVGGGSPQLANLHTPHAHNTPITSSPSPVAGTPGGLRSRSSTLGSYGPWLPSRGVSPNTSLARTPEGQDEPLPRPRAATINTHTSPASAHSPKNEADHLKKPLLSATNLLVLADDSQSSCKENLTSTLSADAITLNIDNMDPTDVTINIGDDGDDRSDIADSTNHHHVIPFSPMMSRSKSETLLTSERSAASSGVSHNTSVSPLIYNRFEFTEKHNCSCADSSATLDAANSGMCEYHTHLQSIPSETEKRHNGTKVTPSVSESRKPLSLQKCCSSTDRDRCNCKIGTSGIDEDYSKEKESKTHMKQNYLLLQENNGTDNSFKTSNGKKLAAPEMFTTTSQIPNGTDEMTSGSADDFKSALNCDDAFGSQRKGTETSCIEATPNQCRTREGNDETSHHTPEFYKFLPKILRRKDESKKSKSSRTGKGWFSSMMRHRSYHGLSLEVIGSKQLPRAQSISGAMET